MGPASTASAFCCLLLASAACCARPDADPHAQHEVTAEPLVRSTAAYRVDGLRLLRSDGRAVSLEDELRHDGPLVLDFVFTTCTAICPIQSRTFAELQARGDPARPLRLVSISIDPLHDTPAALRAYARQFGAREGWRFYTGTLDQSLAAQRAFDVYRGNKMNHVPLAFVRRAPGQPWVRLEGYAGVEALLREIRPATPAGGG